MNEQEKQIVLGSTHIKYSEEDRIFALLYKAYTLEIGKYIRGYEEALRLDSKAVGNIKMTSIKTVLKTNHSSDELVPYAGAMQVMIREYREAHDYDEPSMALYSLREAFEKKGLSILEQIFTSGKYGLEKYELYKRLQKFENQCYIDEYQNEYCGGSFEEYVADFGWNGNYDDLNETILIKYMSKRSWDIFQCEDDRFGDIELHTTNAEAIINEVLKEIAWRQEYLKNPNCNSLVSNIHVLCKKTILEVISGTSLALELNLNPEYTLWDNYQKCLRNIEALKANHSPEAKQIVLEALKCFPFEKTLYKYLYREYGDLNGDVTSLAEYFDLDVVNYKKEVLEEYIKSLSPLDMDSEYDISNRLLDIENKKIFLAVDEKHPLENTLEKRLQEIDILKRTVRGVLYDTREEASKVQKDYSILDDFIKSIDFNAYDLLHQKSVEEIKAKTFALPYESLAFHNNDALVLAELAPILNYQIKLQTWKSELIKSDIPWCAAQKIILESRITDEYKEKMKYWDFNGLKKYIPVLIENERPIVFLQNSLFGWSNYYVITNKRVLHISKNVQNAVEFDDSLKLVYQTGKFVFRNQTQAIEISVKYPDKDAGYFIDVFNLLIDIFQKMDEKLFCLSDGYYQMKSAPSAQEVVTSQIKDIFQTKITPFWKTAQKTVEDILKDSSGSVRNKSDVKYCTQCGAMAKKTDCFCSMCGTKLQN